MIMKKLTPQNPPYSSFYETASETEGIEDEGNEADSEDNSDEECATKSPIPWECCNQIICDCTRISPVEYVDYDSDDEEIAQENEETGRRRPVGETDRQQGSPCRRRWTTEPICCPILLHRSAPVDRSSNVPRA